MFKNTKEEWLKAKRTESDEELENLLAFGWDNERIINEFSKKEKKPEFSKTLFVNEDLCKMIINEWETQNKIQESDEANYKSSHY